MKVLLLLFTLAAAKIVFMLMQSHTLLLKQRPSIEVQDKEKVRMRPGPFDTILEGRWAHLLYSEIIVIMEMLIQMSEPTLRQLMQEESVM